MDAQGDQPLLRTVVEIPLDPRPLRVCGTSDPGARLVEVDERPRELPRDMRVLRGGADVPADAVGELVVLV